MTKRAGILLEDMCTFLIIFRLIHLRMANISDKHVTENQNARFYIYIYIYIYFEIVLFVS